MSKKKRIAIISIIVAIIVLIIITTLVVLYLNTDIFKSNQSLFIKYIMQNADNIDNTVQNLENNNNILDNKKYTSTTNVKLNYTENTGTSSESSKNSINHYSLLMEGKTDKEAGYNFQNIKVLENNEEEKMHLEYIQDNNTYGIKFSDLFNQYILVDNYNLKDVYKNINENTTEISSVPDSIPDLENLKEALKFSREESDSLKEKYKNILEVEFQKGKITKKTNQIITVNGQDIKTTAYSINLTIEQINNIYLKLLEEIKQDDIILSKLDNINKILNSYSLVINSNKQVSLKETYVKKIQKRIDEINKTNIGQEETQIIVYTKNKDTIRTQINYPDYEINLDFLKNQYVQLKIQKIDAIETKTITLNYNDTAVELGIDENKDGKVKGVNISKTTQTDGNNIKDNIIIKYENGTNKIEANVDRNITLMDELKDIPEIKEESKIKLNDLDKDTTKQLIEKINSAITEKINTTFVNNEKEDFNKILKTIGIIQDVQTIEATGGVTESEKNRYNSQFEILQGENLTGENIISSLQAAQNSINGIEVVSNTELKVNLERNKKNEAVVNQLIDFVKEKSQVKYNVKIEYDENGLAKYIVLNLVTER